MREIGRSLSRLYRKNASWIGHFAAGACVIALLAGVAAAQDPPPPSMNDPVVAAQGGNVVGMLIIYLMGDDGKPVTGSGMVTILRAGEVSGEHQMTSGNGMVRFSQLANAAYTVIVSVTGYQDERSEADITSVSSVSELTITMHRVGGDSSQEDAKGMVLAPKAKKEAQKGIDAMRAGQYDEAEKHLEAAYKLAPGNPDLNDRLGELYLATKNYDKAQPYLRQALSIEPDNAAALTDVGWLHVQQGDCADAETSLQKAIAADPEAWSADWLLGICYLRQGKYEDARGEAATAVKVGKGQAFDAEYLLGESLALLGRNDEAIKALQDLLKDAPNYSNAAAAQTLIAKLEAGGLQVHSQPVSPSGQPQANAGATAAGR